MDDTHIDVGQPARTRPFSTVTVVVPTKNAARTLAACLESLRAQTHRCRIVVVDNGSNDGTPAIAERSSTLVLHAGPERSAQRNVGARAYPADVVGFVDADMVLAPTVVAEAVAAIGEGAGSVIVPERTIGSGFWVEVRAFERSFYDGSDRIEAARFFAWDVFDRAGGFDEQLTGPEDWDLSESARELAPVARVAAVIEHDEGTIGYLDACRKKAYYAEGVRRYVAKRGLWAVSQASRRPWLRHPRKLLTRHGAGLVALKAGEALGVALALVGVLICAPIRRAADRRITSSNFRSVAAGGTEPPESSSITQPGSGIRILRSGRKVWGAAVVSAKVCLTMRHRIRTLSRIAYGFVAPDQAGDVIFTCRNGLQLVAPAGQFHWWPILEVVVDDCYRMDILVSELGSTACQVFDVGAHVGSFTAALAKALPGAQVTAFEPAADRVAYLRRNVLGNNLADRVTVVPAAVAGHAGRSTLLGGEVVADSAGADGEVIDLVAFDDVMDGIEGPIDLLKMDCEGGEYDIVASASEAALRRIDRLVLEYHPAPPAQVAQLFARLAAVGLVERWRHDTLSGQLGEVFLSRDRAVAERS